MTELNRPPENESGLDFIDKVRRGDQGAINKLSDGLRAQYGGELPAVSLVSDEQLTPLAEAFRDALPTDNTTLTHERICNELADILIEAHDVRVPKGRRS